jgi:hypothetical protein
LSPGDLLSHFGCFPDRKPCAHDPIPATSCMIIVTQVRIGIMRAAVQNVAHGMRRKFDGNSEEMARKGQVQDNPTLGAYIC